MKYPIIWSIGLAKFALAGLISLIARLITPLLGLPNISPLMATELAGAKAYGPWIAGAYGFMGMALLDIATGQFDPVRTSVTSLCYAIVGIAASFWWKGRPASLRDFAVASVAGTLFFDIVTGVIMTPLLYDMAWTAALAGQVPFTAKHLVGNLVFALAAPWFYRAFVNCTIEFRLLGFKGGTI